MNGKLGYLVERPASGSDQASGEAWCLIDVRGLRRRAIDGYSEGYSNETGDQQEETLYPRVAEVTISARLVPDSDKILYEHQQ